MQLKEILTSPVETVGPESSLLDAAKTMLARDLGWLPVEDEGKVIGVITDRDIAMRGVAAGLDTKKTMVQDVMTRNVFSCSSDGTVEDACALMEEEQVRRLVVLDDDDALVGIVSLADIALQTRGGQSAEVLKKVTEPA
jgi:CBS domain-containing protein